MSQMREADRDVMLRQLLQAKEGSLNNCQHVAVNGTNHAQQFWNTYPSASNFLAQPEAPVYDADDSAILSPETDYSATFDEDYFASYTTEASIAQRPIDACACGVVAFNLLCNNTIYGTAKAYLTAQSLREYKPRYTSAIATQKYEQYKMRGGLSIAKGDVVALHEISGRPAWKKLSEARGCALNFGHAAPKATIVAMLADMCKLLSRLGTRAALLEVGTRTALGCVETHACVANFRDGYDTY